MKGRTLAILVVVLAALLGLYALRSRPVQEVGISTESVSALPTGNAPFDEIILSSPGKTAELALKNGQWKVRVDGHLLDADPSVVDPIVDVVRTLSASEKVSTGEAPEDFGLSSSAALTVRVFNNGKSISVVHVGNPGSGYRGNFVRFNDKKAIYLTREMVRYTLDKSVEDLREKRFFGNLHPDDVAAVQLQSASGSVALQNKNGKWQLEMDGQRQSAKADVVAAYLQQVLSLRAAADPSPAEWGDATSASADLTLSISPQSGAPLQLELFQELPAQPGHLAARSSYLARPSTFYSYQFASLLKSTTDFAAPVGGPAAP